MRSYYIHVNNNNNKIPLLIFDVCVISNQAVISLVPASKDFESGGETLIPLGGEVIATRVFQRIYSTALLMLV